MKKRIVMILAVISVMLAFTGCQKEENADIVMVNPADDTASDEVEKEESSAENETESVTADFDRVVCWGDSLTFGQGGEGTTFPSVLAEYLPDKEVINYGIRGETIDQIAIRAGVLPMTVSAFTIPADTTPVQVYLWQDEEDPIMMRLGDSAINPCSIAGVEGTLSYNADEVKYYFTRSTTGTETAVAEQTQVMTHGDTDKRDSDLIVLFAGTNRAPDIEHVQELIDLEKMMIEYIGSDAYIIIGLTSKELVEDVEAINVELAKAFGEHFLDIRTYYLTEGLSDAGYQPTEQDLADIEAGEIPSQLRVDVVHGNDVFYRLLGEQVYHKMQELGYCP